MGDALKAVYGVNENNKQEVSASFPFSEPIESHGFRSESEKNRRRDSLYDLRSRREQVSLLASDSS